MQRRILAAATALSLATMLSGCATVDAVDARISRYLDRFGWTTLIDGANGLNNFERVGEADWMAADGTVMAQGGKTGFLVTRTTYRDFTLRAEFWASDDANSGIFFRCQEPTRITDENCYEANIFDQRPDPLYGTGAIVKVAQVAQPMPKAGGKWNTFEITARGPQLVVLFNGVKTVDVHDPKLVRGPIALQWARGTIKWRKLEVKPI